MRVSGFEEEIFNGQIQQSRCKIERKAKAADILS